MKQFDLEEYLRLKEEGKEPKIVTRDGRDARIICTDRQGSQPVVALVSQDVDYEEFYSFYANGLYTDNLETILDLFFAPTKRKGWVNVFDNGSVYRCGSAIFLTEEEAKTNGKKIKQYLTTVPIEWEEQL